MKGAAFSKGRGGEERAARELERRGITIIARNVRSPSGEIDLVGVENGTLIFVEVKSWECYGIDSLELSVNKKKQRRIIETAKFFLSSHQEYADKSIRFDILFIGQDGITHIPSAWTET